MSNVNINFFAIIFLSSFYVMCQKKENDKSPINLNLPEGAACQHLDYDGTCVSAYRCLSMLVGLKYENYVPLCSFKGDVPIVCCTDCELVEDVRVVTFIPYLGVFYRNRPRVSDRKCLQYLDELPYGCKSSQPGLDYDFDSLVTLPTDPEDANCKRLLASGGWAGADGVEIRRDQFPHFALLGYGEELDSAEYRCAGSVISENYILTAAHCIADPELGPVKYVALGVMKRSDPPDSWQRYEVKRVIPHPGYKAPSKYNDIALLETEEQIEFDETVLPACLNVQKQEYFEEGSYDVFFKKVRRALNRHIVNTTYAIGSGLLSNDLEPDEYIQKIRLERYEDRECSKLYQVHRTMERGYDNLIQMCYGDYELATDMCRVDSGGPLQMPIRANIYDCQHRVIGVVSSGNPCGTKGGAGLYTKVDAYVPWIESVVWPNENL